MFKNYKKIHFVGAGGIGVSALAKWALAEGVAVSGSDAAQSEITDELAKMGARIFIPHLSKKGKGQAPHLSAKGTGQVGPYAEDVLKDVDLIIYSDAVPASNPERHATSPFKKGGQRGILEKSYFEALGEISRQKKTLAISGTNGKSTTTAMLGKILIDAGLDPTIIVGSKTKDFKYGNLHIGKGDFFVVEACEHNAHMLHLSPEYIILTNIEADHLDFYKNLKNILTAFEKYVSGVPDSGFVIYNLDDKNTQSVVKKAGGRRIGYGTEEGTDFRFENRRVEKGKQLFDVLLEGKKLGAAELSVPGLFNVYNAMAAISAAYSLGVDFGKIKKSLAGFGGLWRRFELVGKYKGAPVISDYGHHPTAVAATILAAREFYPGRRVVVAFQPHQHHRTRALFADFVRAFDDADVVILSEIYNVAGRVSAGDKNISSKTLSEKIVKYWETDEDQKREREMIYCDDLDETETALRKNVKKNDIVIIMGAGDVYKVAMKLAG